jgi:SAM-dependent methyltransferase
VRAPRGQPPLTSTPPPTAESTVRHPESFLRLDAVGTVIPPYRPTFTFAGEYLDEAHRRLATSPLKDGMLIQLENSRWFGQTIQGWLQREDALKLYEIAHFVKGDILELGSFHGLSTSILSRANRHSPFPKRIESVDLSRHAVRRARFNLWRQGLGRAVSFSVGDALAEVRDRAGRGARYGMVFVDHSHAYGPVYQVCRELRNIVRAGGFCLFHDFNDPRNYDLADVDHGVYQAVVDGLAPADFDFYGIYGCLALYRAR